MKQLRCKSPREKLNIVIINRLSRESLIENAFKEFSCQRETDLEDFLIRKAIPYEKTNYGKTHLFIDVDKIGFK